MERHCQLSDSIGAEWGRLLLNQRGLLATQAWKRSSDSATHLAPMTEERKLTRKLRSFRETVEEKDETEISLGR